MENLKKSLKSLKSWEKIIFAFEKSNLGKSKFCKMNNLNLNHFYYWCNKLRPDLKSKAHISRPNYSLFLPAKTKNNDNSFCITLKKGQNVRFSSLPEPLWMAKFVKSFGNLND